MMSQSNAPRRGVVHHQALILSIVVLLLVTPCVRCFSSSASTTQQSSSLVGSTLAIPKSSVIVTPSTSRNHHPNQQHRLTKLSLWPLNSKNDSMNSIDDGGSAAVTIKRMKLVGSSLILGIGILAGSMSFSGMAYADEVGRNVDAPTLYTGEEIMICTKRGPLGACKTTITRTKANDNDKATAYFNDPELAFQEKYKARQLQAIEDERNGVVPATSEEFDGNALIAQLKEKSAENKAKNDGIVRQKTLANNLGANFGPFSSKVPILNADGVDYTLLDAPQAMRLKNAGYIGKDKKFITQPTQEVMDEAAAQAEGSAVAKIGRFIKGALGNDDDPFL
mmetsp:Transcript_16722/g.19858  ORF Transcript_16722/g.19858 Transcript_16722/m.19858 type:complete len:336 (+) Transcript_16722:132-1139(+)